MKFLSAFTAREKRNIAIYIVGIMCYKFALEWFNGSFVTLANERFGSARFKKIGILTGTNSAMQCVGSILIAPLIKKFPTRSVLSAAVLVFALLSSIHMIADAATGGQIKFNTPNNRTRYGTWNPNGLFPIFIITGVSYGMVELIRRVIPRDIVGGNVQKLRRMDAIVHVMYEVAGTAGAFTSTTLIGKFGYNYSAFLSPVFFTCAAIAWIFISDVQKENRDAAAVGEDLAELEQKGNEKKGFVAAVMSGFYAFFKSCYLGAFIVFSSRKYCWLFFGYSVALYGHRYLENGIAPIFARQVIGVSSYSQIMVGGSNFGELLGALSVLLLTNKIPTPIPWLRIDALMLNLVWVLPFIQVARGQVSSAWKIAGIFIPVSFGWAAGDVSLAAYIQSSLARIENKDKDVSALGCVMAFLYVTYIVIYAILSATLGAWADRQVRAGRTGQDILKYVGGVQFTVLSVVVIASTFIPRGALTLNPQLIEDQTQKDLDLETTDTDSIENEKKVEIVQNYHAKENVGPVPPVAPPSSAFQAVPLVQPHSRT